MSKYAILWEGAVHFDEKDLPPDITPDFFVWTIVDQDGWLVLESMSKNKHIQQEVKYGKLHIWDYVYPDNTLTMYRTGQQIKYGMKGKWIFGLERAIKQYAQQKLESGMHSLNAVMDDKIDEWQDIAKDRYPEGSRNH